MGVGGEGGEQQDSSLQDGNILPFPKAIKIQVDGRKTDQAHIFVVFKRSTKSKHTGFSPPSPTPRTHIPGSPSLDDSVAKRPAPSCSLAVLCRHWTFWGGTWE